MAPFAARRRCCWLLLLLRSAAYCTPAQRAMSINCSWLLRGVSRCRLPLLAAHCTPAQRAMSMKFSPPTTLLAKRMTRVVK